METKKISKKEICACYGMLHGLINGIWVKEDKAAHGRVFYYSSFININFIKNKPVLQIYNPKSFKYSVLKTFYSVKAYNNKWSVVETKIRLGGK